MKPEWLERLEHHGHVRKVEDGEILLEPGTKHVNFNIVKSGELEIVQTPGPSEKIVAVVGPGQFTGEANVLFGRPDLVQIRVSQKGELIELPQEKFIVTPLAG